MYLLLGYGFANKQVYKFLKNKRKKVIIYDDFIKNNKKIEKQIDLSKIKTIVVSPGIHYNNPILLAAEKLNIPIKVDLDILYKYRRKNDIFVGLTGSNGKSTTVSIISFLLKEFSINHLLCGNIGKSIFAFKKNKKTKNYIYIIEISSYQAHYMKDIRFNIGTIININSNHDEWHGSKENYINAKKKLLEFSRIPISYINGPVKNNWQINNNILSFKDYSYKITNNSLKLNHNQSNLLVALKILETIFSLLNKKNQHIFYEKINSHEFEKNINKFKGLEFRQEIIINNQEILIVNDSKSTNISSSVTAINSFIQCKNNKKLILIIGGIIKGDLDLLNKEILELVDNIYIFGSNREILKAHIVSINYNSYEVFNSLKELINYIINNKFVYINNILLFSPGGSSYDEFNNYIERGKYFNQLKKEFN